MHALREAYMEGTYHLPSFPATEGSIRKFLCDRMLNGMEHMCCGFFEHPQEINKDGYFFCKRLVATLLRMINNNEEPDNDEYRYVPSRHSGLNDYWQFGVAAVLERRMKSPEYAHVKLCINDIIQYVDEFGHVDLEGSDLDKANRKNVQEYMLFVCLHAPQRGLFPAYVLR